MPMQNELLIEASKIVYGLAPKDITGSAQTANWVSFKEYRKCAVHIMTGAWAGGTSAVTLTQATDNAGSGEKSLAFTKYYASTSTSDTVVETTVSGNTYNLSAANKLHIIEVWAFDLDLANGFTWFRVNLASPGSNADLVSILYNFYAGGRSARPATLPSVLS